jgi:MoxR-like ATPase
MMEIHIGYPTPAQEEEIVEKTTAGTPPLPAAAFDRTEFLDLRDLVLAVPAPKNVVTYAVRVCGASRPADPRADQYAKDYVAWGAGPRGPQNLMWAAKARALLESRTAPTIEDVRGLALPILRHRIIPNHRAVGDGVSSEKIVRHLLETVPA